MKEYMLLIRNEIDHQAAWSSEQQQEFLKKCEAYIADLTREGRKTKIGSASYKRRHDNFQIERGMEGRPVQ